MASQDNMARANSDPHSGSTSVNQKGPWSAQHREELLYPNGRLSSQHSNGNASLLTQDHQYARKVVQDPPESVLGSKLCSFALTDILPLLLKADFAGAFKALCSFAIQFLASNNNGCNEARS